MRNRFYLALITTSLISISPARAQTITTFASGFTSPVGINRDSDGNLWVAEPGTGINDGRVFMVDLNAVAWLVVDGMPSYLDTITHEVSGPWRAIPMDNHKLLVIVGGGPEPNAGNLMTFDLTNHANNDPPLSVNNTIEKINVQSFMLGLGYTESNPYSAVVGNDSNLYVVDAGADAIVKVEDSTQALSVFATFDSISNTDGSPPLIDYVPTDIVNNDSDGFLVCNLTGSPFIPGLASIARIDSADSISTYASNLSLLVDLEKDSVTGNLYALQFGEFDSSGMPIPSSAKIFLITDSSTTLVADNFGPSGGMTLDGEGGFYVTSLLTGEVLHITLETTGIDNPLVTSTFPASPNPFTDKVTIEFYLDKMTNVRLSVFNLMGEEVFSQYLGMLGNGLNNFIWNGKTAGGNEVAKGMYLMKINAGSQSITTRLVKN